MAVFEDTLFIALDLEMEQPSDEVLSVGVNLFSGDDCINESHNFYITPTQPVSTFIQELTGIRETDFSDAPRSECYRELTEWVNGHISNYCGYKWHREAITWGCGDVPLLRADMRKEGSNFEWLSQRFIDVKTMFLLDKATSGKSFSSKTSLNTAMKELGIVPEGTAHNSMYDAINTKEVFMRLMWNQINIKRSIKQISALV